MFTDFNANKVEVDGKNYKNCCIELKVSEKNIKESLSKHVDNVLIVQLKVENQLS